MNRMTAADGETTKGRSGGCCSKRMGHELLPVFLPFIRVFLADFDQDGRPEVVAANKGDQLGDAETANTISWFERIGDPLDDASWIEHELTRIIWPINSQSLDLDADGDLDVVGVSGAESRIMWFENRTPTR